MLSTLTDKRRRRVLILVTQACKPSVWRCKHAGHCLSSPAPNIGPMHRTHGTERVRPSRAMTLSRRVLTSCVSLICSSRTLRCVETIIVRRWLRQWMQTSVAQSSSALHHRHRLPFSQWSGSRRSGDGVLPGEDLPSDMTMTATFAFSMETGFPEGSESSAEVVSTSEFESVSANGFPVAEDRSGEGMITVCRGQRLNRYFVR